MQIIITIILFESLNQIENSSKKGLFYAFCSYNLCMYLYSRDNDFVLFILYTTNFQFLFENVAKNNRKIEQTRNDDGWLAGQLDCWLFSLVLISMDINSYKMCAVEGKTGKLLRLQKFSNVDFAAHYMLKYNHIVGMQQN